MWSVGQCVDAEERRGVHVHVGRKPAVAELMTTSFLNDDGFQHIFKSTEGVNTWAGVGGWFHRGVFHSHGWPPNLLLTTSQPALLERAVGRIWCYHVLHI